MVRRKRRQALTQNYTLVLLLQRDLRIVRRILDRRCSLFIQFLGTTPAERRESLVPCNRQEPGRDGGPSLKSIGLTPHVQEHLADQLLCGRRIADETQDKSV